MMKVLFPFLLASVSCLVHAQAAPAFQQRAEIQPGAALFVAKRIDPSAQHECQPLAGDVVDITGKPVKFEGIVEALPVRVVSGRCAGAKGWIGTSMLKVINSSTPS